jgi:hypothetical protein
MPLKLVPPNRPTGRYAAPISGPALTELRARLTKDSPPKGSPKFSEKSNVVPLQDRSSQRLPERP